VLLGCGVLVAGWGVLVAGWGVLLGCGVLVAGWGVLLGAGGDGGGVLLGGSSDVTVAGGGVAEGAGSTGSAVTVALAAARCVALGDGVALARARVALGVAVGAAWATLIRLPSGS
jgi:hypothetical protein